MVPSVRLVVTVGLCIALAACDMQPQEEFIVLERDTVTMSSSYKGKFR